MKMFSLPVILRLLPYAAAACAAGYIYWQGTSAERQRQQLEQLKADKATLELQRDYQRMAYQAASKAALTRDNRNTELEQQVEAYATELANLKSNSTCVLDGAAIERLQRLETNRPR